MSKCHLLLFPATINHFLIRLGCVTKSGFYTTTSSGVVPRRSSKALYKAKLAPTKGSCHCLVIYHPSDPLQLSESWWNHYIWEVCSANWWDALKTAMPQPALVNRMGPFCCLLHNTTQSHVAQPALQKLNELGYKVLPHLPYSPDLSKSDLHIFKQLNNFVQGKCFHKQQDAENAFQEFVESWSMLQE